MDLADTVKNKYSYLSNRLSFLKGKNPGNFNPDQQKCIHTLYEYFYNYKSFPGKETLRKELKKQRAACDTPMLEAKSSAIAEKVLKSRAFTDARTVFCYLSYNKEIKTDAIVEAVLKQQKRLAVPVVTGSVMVAAGVKSLDNFEKNSYGILEPMDYTPFDKEEIDLIIVPGFGFNPFGYRVGYGGGFYDKYLDDFRGTALGLVFSDFVLYNFVPSGYDIPVNQLIIE